MIVREEHFLWVEKYRPLSIAETILPRELKAHFQQFVDQKNIPNLLLSGSAGVGKTTVARAMLEEIGCDYMIINGSLNRGIDLLRNELAGFATTMSFSGGRKYVILDEADSLTHIIQPALRNFMEEYSKNCGFILTCNYKNRIIPALHSRCSVVDFSISKKEAQQLAKEFFKRACQILELESITFDPKVVATLIGKYYPDWRRTLNELQRYSSTGTIDSGILVSSNTSITSLIGFMKDKNYTEVRHWVKENLDSDANALLRSFYDASVEHFDAGSIPLLVIFVAKYQYQGAFSADPEVNIMAFLAECMVNLDFK
ncbi:MAG: AAA family ATPase [Candidatus Bathyarchaeia archaeon]